MQQVWPSTAFAPQAAAATTLAAALDFAAAPGAFLALCSARFSGTIVDADASELLNFSALSDGGVRLWIDEWLVIDAGGNRSSPASPQRFDGFLNVPFTRGVPRALRLEYSRWGAAADAPATLQLFWRGNVTALAVVPAAAFAPDVSNFLVERNALRDRLEVPRVPWQTYVMASLGAHALMPAGLALSATLAVNATTRDGATPLGAGATLGNIVVFRNGNPALVRPGLRSLNGSDYTLLTISQWAPAGNATVTFETTVVNGGDLVFLARCAGSGCADLLLVVSSFMMAERAGTLSAGADGLTLSAELPGFAPVTATALSGGPPPAPWNCGSAQPCFALSLAGGAAGYQTGAGPPINVAAAQAAVNVAAAAALAAEAPFGALAPLWEGLCSALAWNTVYTPYDGVVTPVSHVMGNIWGVGYILFEWDTYFLALMASAQAGIARDLAYANLIQVTLGRTLVGFVPNGGAGPRRTYDRSENQVGARVLKAIFDRWGDQWLLDGLLPVMLSWNEWEWTRRRGEGVLAGADGLADLMCLGSDPSSPRSDVQETLQAAKYEGMDNSPIYDAPAVFYNFTTSHMNVYDVGATALFASDTEATIALCAVASTPCAALEPPLPERLSRVQAAMNAHMWSEEAGLYVNLLFNGTTLPTIAPTSVFPLLSGTASDAQAAAMAAALASPRGFCYNLSHTPAPGSDMIVSWSSRRGSRPAACLTAACTRAAIEADSSFVRIEAVALLPEGGPAPGLLALSLYEDAATGNTALVAGEAPGGNFSLVRQEGWCWPAPPALPSAWPTTPLTLWHSQSLGAFKTCGTAACEAATQPDFSLVRTMCFALNGTGADNMPCRVGGASLARADAHFDDQDYWRGRAWAPHHLLVYWALLRYDHVPAARAVRKDLVAMGAGLHRFSWDNFGVVCENVNGMIGTCEDSGDADPL